MRPISRAIPMAGSLSVLMCLSSPSRATEGGQTAWPLGVQTVVPGILPPPGATEYYDYFQEGTFSSLNGTNEKPKVPGFHLNVVVNASRILHTWSPTASGLTFTSGFVLPVSHLDLRAAGQSGSVTNTAYVDLSPLYVSWHSKYVFLNAGCDFYLPQAGQYSPNNFVNTGLNYYTFMPQAGFTWLPNRRVEVDADFTISYNTTNHATHYHSGAVADIEYALGYRPFPRLLGFQVGLNGDYAKQVSDDTQFGQRFADGNRLQIAAIGPHVGYFFTPATAVVLKWQHELAVENAAAGERFWLEFAFPI